MATAPNFNPVQADTRVLTGEHIDSGISPGLAAAPGQELQGFGNALVGASDAALRIATQMQMNINQTQVDDALNKTREATLSLTYDPDQGYTGIKGNAALQRDSGMSLPDEYGEKLGSTISNLSEQLGNDEQRRQFALRANDIATSFKGNVESHTLQEFKSYSLSVQDGAVKLGQDEAKRNWSDPVRVDTALSSVNAAVLRAGQLQGKSANQIISEMQAATSMVHLGVIDAALQNNNPTYASLYLDKNKGGMTADDILRVNGAINHDLDGRIAQQAVTQTVKDMQTRFVPSDVGRLTTIVNQMESGGKDANADGTPVTSPKGAKYAMQVMPATAENPGFGIAPAKDDSAAEYNRVGQQYLQALVMKYGNTAQALAAYNAGPGKEGTSGYDAKGQPLPGLAPAMARADAKGAPQNWSLELPKETQLYIKSGLDKFGAGAGASPMPTEQEFISNAVARLGDNPRPTQVQLTRTAAEQQFQIITKSVRETGEQAVVKAQQTLISNGGDFSALPNDMKMAVAQYGSGKFDDLLKFAKAVSKGDNETDSKVYMGLATYPEEMAKLSDSQFMQLRTKLSEADFKHFSNERADILNGKVTDNSEALNTKALNTALTSRLTSVGINAAPGPKDQAGRQQVGTIQKYVRDDLFAQQAQIGRKLAPAEVEQRIDKLFATDLTFRKTFMGFDTGTTQQTMLSMKVGDIPSDSLTALRSSFTRAGVSNPTDDQILRAYWKSK